MFKMLGKLSVKLLVLFTIITSVLSEPIEDNWLGSEFSVVQKLYDDCQTKNDFTGCLKGKALIALSKAIDKDSISLLDGIVLVKENTTDNDTPGLYEPRMLNGFSSIDKALLQKLDKFFKTHTLKIDMSEQRSKGSGGGGGGGGGGGKKGGKKMGKYVITAMMTAMGIAGPLGLNALFFIAGKALIISKVALTIAGIIALQKIFSSDHHEETSFQVHAGGGEHNRRNTYLVRPVKQNSAPVDPYKYYYDQQYPSQLKTYQQF